MTKSEREEFKKKLEELEKDVDELKQRPCEKEYIPYPVPYYPPYYPYPYPYPSIWKSAPTSSGGSWSDPSIGITYSFI